MQNRYYSAKDYYKEIFGCDVYKLALTGGLTCPNRDGSKGIGGCIFCSEKGSGDFATNLDINSYTQSINNAKNFIKNKIKPNSKYIAYFQSFTSTYMDFDRFKRMINLPLNDSSISGISIATRPDCLPQNILDYLSECVKRKPIFVELGLQTIHNKTAELINRQYDLDTYLEAVKRLKKIGVNVITHVIIGLPNESREDILKTIDFVGRYTDGIKLQLLHVIHNTQLEQMYINKVFEVLSLEEYVDILCDAINILPKNVVIHRLTGDAKISDLVAPVWSKDKKKVLNYINHQFKVRNVFQGKFFK